MSINLDMLSAEAQVVPGERVPELIKFYVTGLVTEACVIIEELRTSELLTEDSKGKWALVQFEAAAKSLCLCPFVEPLDKGGVEVPLIVSQERYIKAFLKSKSELISDLESTFSVRKRYRDQTLVDLEESQIILEEWESLEVEPAVSESEEDVKAFEARVKERDDEVVAQKRAVDRDYNKWRLSHSELMTDQQKVADWTATAQAKAIKQHAADCDALLRVEKALGLLKKFLHGLMVTVPGIRAVVKKMGTDGVDPYIAGDLRRCYTNLLDQYRKCDELGVATCLMGGMKLHQSASQSLRVFVRKVEEFHETLKLLGVKVITIADLAAMVAIGGMLEKHRVAFLQSESALALALDSMSDESTEAGGELSVGGSARLRRALFTKVLAFVDSDENQALLSTGFGKEVQGGGAQGGGAQQSAADRRLTLEQRNVMSASEEVAPVEKPCFTFAMHGVCPFGEKCRYSHQISKRMAKRVNSLKSVAFKEPEEKVSSVTAAPPTSSAVHAVFGCESDAQWSGFEYESDVDAEDM